MSFALGSANKEQTESTTSWHGVHHISQFSLTQFQDHADPHPFMPSIANPIFTTGLFPICKGRIIVQLVAKLLEPGMDGSCSIEHRVSDALVMRAGLCGVSSPHVCNLRTRCCDNFPAANPHSHALIDVLTTPTQHLGIKASTLVPPVSGHSC